jgi:hypothetical protein
MDLNAWPQRTACSSADAEPHTGTTIVACTYNGGVVLGADGRVSTGNYVSNRASNKISRLTDNVFLLRSGSAADTQAVGDYGKSTRLGECQQVAVRLCAGLTLASRAAAEATTCSKQFPAHHCQFAVKHALLTNMATSPCKPCFLRPCAAVWSEQQLEVVCAAPLTLLHAPSPPLALLLGGAVRYFSEQLISELGEEPSVQTIAQLVATVGGHIQIL